MSKELLVGVIVILSICSIQAQSPSERCELNGGVGKVCNDCFSTLDCEDLEADPVDCNPATMICDRNLADGYCVTATSEESEICMCAAVGNCLTDPNSSALVTCAVIDTIAVPKVTTCSTPTQIFNPDPTVCDCEAISSCPDCGFTAAYPDLTIGCSTEFYYCAGGTGTEALLTCAENTCYNDTTCSCSDFITTPCGDCGYKELEGDSSQYVYCKDGEDKILPCPSGTTYDPILCVCASESATSCATSKPATCPPCSTAEPCPTSEPATCPPCSSTGTCLPCGLEAGSTSCSEYYACDDNGRTGGPYDCPGTLCFDAATCNCI